MAAVTETGIVIERLDEIIETLNNGFRQIYGQNINLDADTPDGQMIGLLAQIKVDFEELAENVYKQLDPDYATGAWLEQRVAYAGLVRKGANYSYLQSAILTGEANSTVYAGVIVSDANKTRWVLSQDVELNALGSGRGDFRSEELGAFSVEAKQKLTIETVQLGLDSVTTDGAAVIGSEEETDSELRQRFYLSRTKNGDNGVESLQSKLLKLADVKQALVLENITDQTDKNGVAKNSINVIVQGGNSQDIANLIYKNKSGGCGLQGDTEVEILVDGMQRTLKFDYAVPVDIAISMRLVRYEDFTEIDKDQIKQELTQLVFEIGKTVPISRLYSPINNVGGFWVKSLTIGRKGSQLKNENVVLKPREVARILDADIEIEVE